MEGVSSSFHIRRDYAFGDVLRALLLKAGEGVGHGRENRGAWRRAGVLLCRRRQRRTHARQNAFAPGILSLLHVPSTTRGKIFVAWRAGRDIGPMAVAGRKQSHPSR